MFKQLVIVHGGTLAKDVAEQMQLKQPADSQIAVTLRAADSSPKSLVDMGNDSIVCFIMQTIENGAPTEDGGSCIRFFKRKTNPESLLLGKFAFAVLGLGDSNLLLDRQKTGAKDCNQVAQDLDSRLAALGGNRCYPLGMADERTGLEEVEPWIDGFWSSLG